MARRTRGDEKVHEWLYTKSKERMSKAMMKEMMSKEKENMDIGGHVKRKSNDIQVHINLYEDAKKRLSKLTRL